MLPNAITDHPLEIIETTQPGLTWALDGREIDELEALAQTVRWILATERFEHAIYDWSYGTELQHLIGMPRDYVAAELPRVITEALMQDDRVLGVSGFFFGVIERGKMHVSFTVETIYGRDLEAETDVPI
ncbi:MAG: DUF2634 domain-containing protein [Bacillota bacterium]|nr:DUF2634 domain-containing protein [Bacillota bacterium]